MSDRRPRMSDAAPRSPLVFFVLLFALSVPFWVAAALIRGRSLLPMGMPVSAFQFVLPLIVACILLYRHEGWQGIAALVARTVSLGGATRSAWCWAVLLVPALMAATYLILLLVGAAPHGSHSPLAAIPVLIVLYAVSAACEEAGWMGYVLDPLQQRMGPLAASVVLGAVWAVWHLVAFVQAGRSALWIVGQCLSTVAIRVAMVWVFDTMGKVVLTAIVAHILINVTQSVYPGFTESGTPAMIFGLVSAAAAMVIAWRWVPGHVRAAQIPSME